MPLFKRTRRVPDTHFNTHESANCRCWTPLSYIAADSTIAINLKTFSRVGRCVGSIGRRQRPGGWLHTKEARWSPAHSSEPQRNTDVEEIERRRLQQGQPGGKWASREDCKCRNEDSGGRSACR